MLVYGINHHKTPIAIREKCVFHAAQLPLALQELAAHTANEAMILSTCNRTEIYTAATDVATLQQWFTQQKSLDIDLNAYCYSYHGMHAVKHIMRVASGLDSVVLGEPQVLGQMKEAYRIAKDAGTIGNHLKHLFPAVFEASKQIRTDTNIGAHAVSIAYAITQISKKIFKNIVNCRVLLIGAGETMELVATHLHGIGVTEIIMANRTVEKIKNWAGALNIHPIQIRDIPAHIKECDIVISATASQLPIIGKGLIENTLQHKKNNPLLLIDLAVPRDIEPEVATLDRIHLFNIDDLQTIISQNLKSKKDAAKQAELMIDLHTSEFFKKMRILRARHVIAEYRNRLEKIRTTEQEKALRQLQNGHDSQMVLEQFGQQLINKIMHHPTIKLREAASEDQCEIFQRIKTFFEL
ncbi:MAG TPA: glutamyl-tRNA reductase [Coxiellaceae bacterium]|nr:MAG: glutamyl-tRNA reductase [Gammaproteobacteria bacterium RIFCSPHIGHO2_12_FULL_36_30]HLB55974.1 glutamyl-tRNA reductase [Coxiellaceae bacterium]